MNTKFSYCNRTGLLYVNEVPFTKEAIKKINKLMKYAGKSSPQIEWSINVKDNHTGESTIIDDDVMIEINEYIAENNYRIASDKDFI